MGLQLHLSRRRRGSAGGLFGWRDIRAILGLAKLQSAGAGCEEDEVHVRLRTAIRQMLHTERRHEGREENSTVCRGRRVGTGGGSMG